MQRTIASCTSCTTLAPWRQFDRTVYGTPTSRYLLVGEAPGYRSWRTGRRFTGPAGLFLRRALSKIGHPRYRDLEDLFYLTDAVKCHPAVSAASMTNRSPRRAELAACLGHLIAELRVLRPTVIVTVGKLATEQVNHALSALVDAGDRWPGARPRLIAFPHPSPRNQVTIRQYYASMEAFESSVTATFRRLIRQLRGAGDA